MPEVAAQERMVDNGSGDVEVSLISIAFMLCQRYERTPFGGTLSSKVSGHYQEHILFSSYHGLPMLASRFWLSSGYRPKLPQVGIKPL